MRQMQVCAHGHHWDPVSDGRADERARYTVCPICGGSVEMYSLGDSGSLGSGQDGAADRNGPGPAPPTVPGYEVLSVLGYGGMGVVYQARQTATGQIVALKMLSAGLRARPAELSRFRREAEAAARLNHPHLVEVHEVGEHDGLPYVVMELMDRGSLAEVVSGNPLPPRTAAEIVELLAGALQHAHDAGIIHRDLKPANVLLGTPPVPPDPTRPGFAALSLLGIPKVTDFGLAKCVDEEVGQTGTGAVLGTPSYMAPEQAMGRASQATPATDVWALGAILYACLTSKAPFQAATILATLDEVRSHDPVPPRAIQPGVPRDLETICLKCLEKDPRRRYPSARELADDLRRFLDGQSIVARPQPRWHRPWRWLRRHATAAVVVLLGLTSAALAASLWRLRDLTHRSGAGIGAVAHYSNFVKRHGLPEGIGLLTEEQVRRRALSYRFYLRGRSVEKVVAIDHHGRPTPRHPITSHLAPAEASSFFTSAFLRAPLSGVLEGPRPRLFGVARESPGGACSWEYQRDENGHLIKETARDLAGRVVWQFHLTSTLTGHYTDERGFLLSRAGSGAAYVQLALTEDGLVREVRYLGRNGKPRPDAAGIFGRRYEHDGNGLVTAVSFLGPRDRPVLTFLGYARITRRWDERGHLLEEAYFDHRDRPARSGSQGAARVRWTYDEDGNPTAQQSVGVDGQLAGPTLRVEYDAHGNLKSWQAIDAPLTPGRASRRQYEYDERDNCTRLLFLTEDGKPTWDTGVGAFGLRMSHDDEGRMTEVLYLGEDGEQSAEALPAESGADRPAGRGWDRGQIVRVRLAYNHRGQVLEEAFFGRTHRPTPDSEGVACYRYTYDDSGRPTEQVRLGIDGKPVRGVRVLARRTWSYDDQGRLEEVCSYDATGRLLSLPGEPGVTFTPSLTAILRFNRLGRAFSYPAGRLNIDYDDRGNPEQITLFGPNNRPAADPEGVARVHGKYDEHGNLAELATFDAAGQPRANASGVARTTYAHDGFGNLTEVATFGPDGRLVASVYGVARHTRRFDDHYNLVEEAFFGPNGKPTLGRFGYAVARFRYDDEDRLIASTYLGCDGRPVLTRVVWLYPSTRVLAGDDRAARLEAGDVVIRYDGKEVRCARLFSQRKQQEGQGGERKEIEVLRKGRPHTLRIPAGALRRDDFFTRTRRGLSGTPSWGIPGRIEPAPFIETRGETHLEAEASTEPRTRSDGQ